MNNSESACRSPDTFAFLCKRIGYEKKLCGSEVSATMAAQAFHVDGHMQQDMGGLHTSGWDDSKGTGSA